MKKAIIICMCFILCACGSKKNNVVKKTNNIKKVEEVKDTYKDDNNTIVGLYLEKGRTLELVTDYSTDIVSGKDIGVYQIYFSNDNIVNLNNKFGEEYYNKIISLDNLENIKVGFNIKYSLSNGENINQTITNPSNTITNGYILNYLYDDYKNRNSNFYSHIEESEYNDDTLFTSIKLYANSVDMLISNIELTVFTYDTEDDFDEFGNYRGNSKYTVNISKK